FFFFQAEDGIRDFHVTGVQTCALPISEQALCIMGNHEFSALGWATPAPPGSGRLFVREHTERHAILLRETHSQFAAHPEEWRAFLDWFQDLPLFVDAGAFRLVHACWDAD